jgi:hypothetical protein
VTTARSCGETAIHGFESRQRFAWAAETAIKSGAGGFQGIGLTISRGLAKQVMDQSLHCSSVHRGYLGVRLPPSNSVVDRQPFRSVPEIWKALDKGPSEKGRLLPLRTAQGGTEYVLLT